jgi:iron complex transport system ATP-binding protein
VERHSERETLEVEGLGFAYDKRPILDGLEFSAHSGDLIALLGPNGAGKSTLIHCILGLERTYTGTIRIENRDIRTVKAKQLAQMVAYIPQSSSQVFDFTVLELVLMGGASRLGLFASPGKAESIEALEVLESLGIDHLAHRGCWEISGGEYQLALLARALFQKTRILLMDEPTASLDYGNQYHVMERIAGLARRDFIVLFSAHDPNQVLRFANRILILENGSLSHDGTPTDVMSAEILSALYGIRVGRYTVGEKDGLSLPVCVPLGKA